jgi:hypothetical protein
MIPSEGTADGTVVQSSDAGGQRGGERPGQPASAPNEDPAGAARRELPIGTLGGSEKPQHTPPEPSLSRPDPSAPSRGKTGGNNGGTGLRPPRRRFERGLQPMRRRSPRAANGNSAPRINNVPPGAIQRSSRQRVIAPPPAPLGSRLPSRSAATPPRTQACTRHCDPWHGAQLLWPRTLAARLSLGHTSHPARRSTQLPARYRSQPPPPPSSASRTPAWRGLVCADGVEEGRHGVEVARHLLRVGPDRLHLRRQGS